MNSFLEREIKADLDLIEKHIIVTEGDLLQFTVTDVNIDDVSDFIHLYETYERLINIYMNNCNVNNIDKNIFTFYVARRVLLKEIKKNLKRNMKVLFNINKKYYKKIIFTYERIIDKYKQLYNIVEDMKVKIIHRFNMEELLQIEYISIRSIDDLKELIKLYNNTYRIAIKGGITEIHVNDLKTRFDTDNKIKNIRLIIRGREIPVILDNTIEFDIKFKNN